MKPFLPSGPGQKRNAQVFVAAQLKIFSKQIPLSFLLPPVLKDGKERGICKKYFYGKET